MNNCAVLRARRPIGWDQESENREEYRGFGSAKPLSMGLEASVQATALTTPSARLADEKGSCQRRITPCLSSVRACPKPACRDSREPVSDGWVGPVKLSPSANVGTPVHMYSVIDTAPVLDADEAIQPDSAELGSKAEQIRTELLSLALQRAEIRKRIRDIRRALTALVKVFGPAILNAESRGWQARAAYISSPCAPHVDLCCEILKRSPQWLTVRQILDVMQKESPFALTSFTNPGASLSNALRCLSRHAQVESQDDGKGRIQWRWIGEHNGAWRSEPGVPTLTMSSAHRRGMHTRRLK
jgi:hypothetical protein